MLHCFDSFIQLVSGDLLVEEGRSTRGSHFLFHLWRIVDRESDHDRAWMLLFDPSRRFDAREKACS